MKYRKKPVVIEAEQFFRLKTPWPDGVVHEREMAGIYTVGSPPEKDRPKKTRWYIETLEGQMEVSDGDWVITGVKGEKYPCKPDIFELTYELVED
jgi:hypothetical protein